ncbi:hypothetical protein [Pedobacter kyungheensis]|uniref:hypothetical protein n=1 Tax=Pedobacter kyungheensis TaxID=1069985 RepID=UPI000A93822E|nr:hypothetical protein [Pedobacter kyungheensis]
MFEQLKNLAGREYYLISSLLLFMVFFIIVSIYLIKLSKNHISNMSELPLKD